VETLQRFSMCVFATVEGDQPRVRPVTLIYLDKKFWVTTGTGSAKVKEIEEDPKIEFCLYLQEGNNEGYARVAGIAKIIRERETKMRIASHCDFFSKHWESVDDPSYTMIEICPVEIEYSGMEEFRASEPPRPQGGASKTLPSPLPCVVSFTTTRGEMGED